MLSRDRVRKGLKNPGLALRYFASKARDVVTDPKQPFLATTEFVNRDLLGRTGIDMEAADWDNLLILDACRYDLFAETSTLPGDLRPVVSNAGWTPDWLERTFDEAEYPDIVYVSASPMINSYCDARFHARDRLWEDAWSEELDVVPPFAVTDRALAAAEEYPDKRLIVHYTQPHHPFIGEFGRELVASDKMVDVENGIEFWNQIPDQPVTKQEFWRAYRENLELTLPEVERLLEGLTGKSVVTSDHGNMFDFFGIYGHMRGYTSGLRRVPWLEVPYDERKTIEPGSATAGPKEENVRGDDLVTERLEKLGYL